MNRVEILRKYIDGILLNMDDDENRRCAYIHLYGVSQAAVFIALKRNENPELAAMAGMLHDIYSYAETVSRDHAHLSAHMAEDILNTLNLTNDRETKVIREAIYHHSEKELISNSFDEVIKDADVFQHCMYNPNHEIKKQEKPRFDKLKLEFGMID